MLLTETETETETMTETETETMTETMTETKTETETEIEPEKGRKRENIIILYEDRKILRRESERWLT